MAKNPIVRTTQKPLPKAAADQRTRAPTRLAQRLKKMLRDTTWADFAKGDELYFGF
jgi:hypothetical protein